MHFEDGPLETGPVNIACCLLFVLAVGVVSRDRHHLRSTRHLCTRLMTDGIEAMSRGFSWGKQVIKFVNTRITVEFVY